MLGLPRWRFAASSAARPSSLVPADVDPLHVLCAMTGRQASSADTHPATVGVRCPGGLLGDLLQAVLLYHQA